MSLSRRRLLAGAGVAMAAISTGVAGLVAADAGPGTGPLRRLLGACGPDSDVPTAAPGPIVDGTLRSRARRSEVGWSVAYPPGSAEDAALPVIVALHGRGGNHRWVFDSLSLQHYLADAVSRAVIAPVAIASIDGGDAVNWHDRANGDDPASMVLDEFVPGLADRGLVTDRVALWGWSLGGYGALLLGSMEGPVPVAAIAASSPALWRSVGDAPPDTFDDADDFATHDVFAKQRNLGGIPLRIDCGRDDPFAEAVADFRSGLDPTPEGGIADGCHDDRFWKRNAADQLRFLGGHLA
jgi:predicted esterase